MSRCGHRGGSVATTPTAASLPTTTPHPPGERRSADGPPRARPPRPSGSPRSRRTSTTTSTCPRHDYFRQFLRQDPLLPNESLGKIPYFPNEPFGKIPYFQNESFGKNTYFVYYALKVSCSRSSTRTRSLGVGRHPGHGAGPEAPTSSRARALGPVDWDLDRVPSTPSGTEGVSAGRPGCVVGRSPRRHVHRALRARGRQQRRGYSGQE